MTGGEHLFVDVEDRNVGRSGRGRSRRERSKDAASDIPRTACHVEVSHAGERGHSVDELVFPETVETSTHNVVHQIVLGGDAIEDTFDEGFLLGDGDLLESEGRGGLRGRGLEGERREGQETREGPAAPKRGRAEREGEREGGGDDVRYQTPEMTTKTFASYKTTRHISDSMLLVTTYS